MTQNTASREMMLKGAADILGTRLAEALARVAELEAREKLHKHPAWDRVAELEAALDNSQSLLVAILLERRPEEEIEAQIIENRAVLAKGREG